MEEGGGYIMDNGELERIRRVSDLLCTAHATLRDRYWARSLALDITILIATFFLTVIALADQETLTRNFGLPANAQVWISFSGILIFSLTLLQLSFRWKEKFEAHSKSFGMCVEVKREAAYLLMKGQKITVKEFQRIADRYDMVGIVGTPIPENLFISLKQKHELKIAVSKALSARPGASVFLTKLRLRWRDNVSRVKDV